MKYAVVVATLTTAGRYALLLFPVLYHFIFSQAAFYTLVLAPSISGEFLKYVKNFKIISERICCLRLKAKWFSCTLMIKWKR